MQLILLFCVIFFVSSEYFISLYSSITMRVMIHNLNNNRKINNSIRVTEITTKATNGE